MVTSMPRERYTAPYPIDGSLSEYRLLDEWLLPLDIELELPSESLYDNAVISREIVEGWAATRPERRKALEEARKHGPPPLPPDRPDTARQRRYKESFELDCSIFDSPPKDSLWQHLTSEIEYLTLSYPSKPFQEGITRLNLIELTMLSAPDIYYLPKPDILSHLTIEDCPGFTHIGKEHIDMLRKSIESPEYPYNNITLETRGCPVGPLDPNLYQLAKKIKHCGSYGKLKIGQGHQIPSGIHPTWFAMIRDGEEPVLDIALVNAGGDENEIKRMPTQTGKMGILIQSAVPTRRTPFPIPPLDKQTGSIRVEDLTRTANSPWRKIYQEGPSLRW